jgi:phospholipid/cholesterol/gamma-HCH transport system substrate-binding protein
VIRTRPSLSARLENVLTTALGQGGQPVEQRSIPCSATRTGWPSPARWPTSPSSRTPSPHRKDALDSGIAHAARTFENTSRASAQIGPVLDRIGRSADAIDQMGQAVARTSASTGKTVDAVGADLQHFGSDTLPELERLMEELRLSCRPRCGALPSRPNAIRRASCSVAGRFPKGPGESSSTGERQP